LDHLGWKDDDMVCNHLKYHPFALQVAVDPNIIDPSSKFQFGSRALKLLLGVCQVLQQIVWVVHDSSACVSFLLYLSYKSGKYNIALLF